MPGEAADGQTHSASFAMQTIGPELFARRPDGAFLSGVGTLFPGHELLFTSPAIHAMQREDFKDWLIEEHARRGAQAPSEAKLKYEAGESVDLIFLHGDIVLIRPELGRIELAFAADQLLQKRWQVPLHRIRFASMQDPRVQQGFRERGELWRMTTSRTDPAHFGEVIEHSRVAINEGRIYYYNANTGTRFLTFGAFSALRDLDNEALAHQMQEIATHCIHRNRHGHPEIAFLGADPLRFGGPNFAGLLFTGLEDLELRARYTTLVEQFRAAVQADLRQDDPQSPQWRLRLHEQITTGQIGEIPRITVPGMALPPDIRWLPGGRFEQGEFIFAPVFGRDNQEPREEELKPLWDPLARGFIANFIREYGNLEYLNLGRLDAAAGAPVLVNRGRRGVYLAELKVRGEANPHVLFLRVQRWGVRERLEEKDQAGRYRKDLLAAIFETEEYLDYTLDRRLGCQQFGMHLPVRFTMRRVTERYTGDREGFQGRFFPVIYFERDFLPGIPTDPLPDHKLGDPRYALELARLLGQAAAPNLVVGRTRDAAPGEPGTTLFDNGDEVIIESSTGLPREIVLVDHSGAFADWKTPSLLPFARGYAEPVNKRAGLVQEPKAFAEAYVAAFAREFARIQKDYLDRQDAFDGLFKHLPHSQDGNFACRWERVLARLRDADLGALVSEIERHIRC